MATALARPASPATLSPRIREAIRQVEDDNEILISWVQAGLVSLLSALYFVSPRAYTGDVAFEPVPLVLAVYAPFVLLRLLRAHRRALGPWMLSLSVLVDVGALLALIWSFHIQYAQPAAFYLKAPTFAYFFIFIALRVLRYEIRYVVLAGAAAAAGWFWLVLYALGPGRGRLTREFVRYVMGYDVLVGAEIDKIVSIVLVTAILAIAVTRSRRLLAMAAYETQARRDLSRFFSPDVAERIVTAENPIRPGQGEVRPAVILTMDIRGFTKLAARTDPSTVMSILAEYQKRMVAAIFENGGTIDKFLGDGILAHFGAATPSETYAADALRAVDALCAAADRWNEEARAGSGLPELGFGVACAAGEVLFGAVGDEERLEYTVIGDAVNLAAKLEKHTKRAGTRTLTTLETFRLAERQGYAPARPPTNLPAQTVEGVAAPLDLLGGDGVIFPGTERLSRPSSP